MADLSRHSIFIKDQLLTAFADCKPDLLETLEPDVRGFVLEQVQWAEGYAMLMELVEEHTIYERQTGAIHAGTVEEFLAPYRLSDETIALLCEPKQLNEAWKEHSNLQSILGWTHEQVLVCYEYAKSLFLGLADDEHALLAALFLTHLRGDVSVFWLMRGKLHHRLGELDEALGCDFMAIAHKPWAFDGYREALSLMIEEKEYDQAKKLLEMGHALADAAHDSIDPAFFQELTQAEAFVEKMAA